jgi:MFS transporter, DHA2 family, multidrug resistance protein
MSAPAAPPTSLSDSPVIGILGVILGAGIVTLAGRLLSLGLADLRGNVGLSVDQGAWVGTVFNAAIMFIGPVSVYLGALLGTRPVLMVCATVFAVISAFLPFVHSYELLLALLFVAGLASGTFYPLTLSFALRNIPIRYLAVTLALYATCIEGAVNFTPALYGFERDHLSWTWMFWTSAVITPVMIACVYWGIPNSPRPRASGGPPSFAGFFYASVGLALLYAALDQGQRLDWWRSGVFTALFTAGAFFVIAALVRRLRGPNPLVDLPFLRKWNTVLLGWALFAFRFCLLATILIIPQSLSVRGLDAAQYAPAVLWTAVPELVLAFIGAYLLNRGLDSRLLNADFTSAWAAENYFQSALPMAVGQSFAFIGLVSTIILQSFFSGGLNSPYRILTFSSFFHVVRLFGGQIGVVLMTRFIAETEKLHSFLIGLHVQPGGWVTAQTVTRLTAGLAAKSGPSASGRAIGLVDSSVRLQAYALTYIDAFHLIAWVCALTLLVIALMKKFPKNYRDLRAGVNP